MARVAVNGTTSLIFVLFFSTKVGAERAIVCDDPKQALLSIATSASTVSGLTNFSVSRVTMCGALPGHDGGADDHFAIASGYLWDQQEMLKELTRKYPTEN
jgi:hypothetical protein